MKKANRKGKKKKNSFSLRKTLGISLLFVWKAFTLLFLAAVIISMFAIPILIIFG